ncbi:NAD(P)/FAD-dependent oxidoreductase [Paenibacillus elgii]
MYDFIIVGARCAGAAIAYFLGKKGYRTLLIDRYTVPGPTLSTHILGETGVYERLGIARKMETSGIPALTRMRIDLEGRLFESDICVTPRALGVRRELLDRWLLDAACGLPEVNAKLSTQVIDLLEGEDGVCGVRCKLPDGSVETYKARAVIGADGRHSSVARRVGAETAMASDERHLGVYYAYVLHADPLPIPAVEWYWSETDIVLCNPIDGGRHCIAVMLPQETFRSWSGDPATKFVERLSRIRTLGPRLRYARLQGSVRGVDTLRSYVRKPFGPGWVLVGDAGAHLHPVSGVGIDNAVCSAEMLAEELDAYMRGERTWTEAMSAYTQRRDERIIPQYEACLKTLARAGQPIPEAHWPTLDVLCTFPGLVKELGGRAERIYTLLTEENEP